MAAAKNFPAISLAEAHALLTRPGSPFELAERDIRGVRTRVWKNAPTSLRAVLELSRGHGDQDYLVYEDERTTFVENFTMAATAARCLRDLFGVQKGDRLSIAMRNLPEL